MSADGEAKAVPVKWVGYAKAVLTRVRSRTPIDIENINPGSGLTTRLELNETDMRTLAQSVRMFIRKEKPGVDVSSSDIQECKKVRDVVRFVISKVSGKSPPDEDVDEAIRDAKAALGGVDDEE